MKAENSNFSLSEISSFEVTRTDEQLEEKRHCDCLLLQGKFSITVVTSF
jgi:hypothetical protein